MQQSSFGTSKLVRQLGQWTPVEAEPKGLDVAERMGQWFNPLDAIRLQAVNHSIRTDAPAAKPSPKLAQQADALAQDVERVRAVLAKAIAQDPLPLPPPGPQEPSYAPFHQRHLELQRQMTQMIAAARDHVRQTLGNVSPRLRQLATLDAAFESLLAPREQSLLPTAAALLERRFKQLRPDVDTFTPAWRQALLAELDLRLEPVAGMVDALRDESGPQP